MALHTKIYGTIGPACCDVDTLTRLFESGMTGIRINLSHTGLRDADAWFSGIRLAYRRFREAQGARGGGADGPEILMDLRGPELRIGRLDEPLRLAVGASVYLAPEGRPDSVRTPVAGALPDDAAPVWIPVWEKLLAHIQPGQQILLDDGKILLEMEVFCREQKDSVAKCKVLRGSLLQSGKSIALPGVSFRAPTLTESDVENIRAAKTYGITGVMLPFVRDREDLVCLKRAMQESGAGQLRIFAKIENLQGVRRLPELLSDCDEVVIARGDLGNAVPLWRLPVIQAQIASLCRERNVPFMVVTQMLASMEQNAVPTRAEVSDIFRAVSEGAASVMLTGETAAGNYPVEAMRCMANTVKEAEHYVNCKIQS